MSRRSNAKTEAARASHVGLRMSLLHDSYPTPIFHTGCLPFNSFMVNKTPVIQSKRIRATFVYIRGQEIRVIRAIRGLYIYIYCNP
jgi:hypothetical protein